MKENKTKCDCQFYPCSHLYEDKTEQIMKWEVEFNKLEVETWGTGRLKGYITKLLSEQRQSILEEVEGLKRTKWEEPIQNHEGYIVQVFNFALDTVISIIKRK